MSRVVYLHVGAPKTGTTYLQDRLALNRGELGKHGVHYPLGLHASQFRPALDLLEMPWGGKDEEVSGEWDSLMARVRRHSGTVVISHEILAAAKPAQVRRAMAGLEGSEVHLVYSARDLARQIPAEWQEGVKHQRSKSFARFLADVQKARRTKSRMWFWRVQGLPDVLSRWSLGLRPEHVHLVTLPQDGAPKDLLWQRYCQAFGVDPAWAPQESPIQNVSIGIAEAAVVRRLNGRLREAGIGADDYRRLVREVMVHERLAHRENMVKASLPPDAYPWAAEVAEEWVDWVVGSGIDVIGSVDELRPVPPAADEPWVDPDEPRGADVIDAAVDALTAIVLEAASRPDPQEQVTAKIGKVARRLRFP